MDAFEILVVILSVALAVLISLAIVLIYHLIKVARTLRKISDKTARLVSNVEQASELVRNSTVPIAVSRFVANIVDNFKGKKSKKGRGNEEE